MRFRAFGRLALAAFALSFGFAAAAQQPVAFNGQNPALPLTHIDNGHNSANAMAQHYVVLVSLDGFRWDYAQRDGAVHLLELGKHGVWAPKGMFPSFPSLTFPNHFTIVTGLYPEHHGLVANGFYDETKKARYAINDAHAVTDGSWYSGAPLWSLAESQECAQLACSGPVQRQKSQAFDPPGTRHSIRRQKRQTRSNKRASMMRLLC